MFSGVMSWRIGSSNPPIFYKTFTKITEKHLWRGLLLDKDSELGPATLLQKHAGIDRNVLAIQQGFSEDSF